MEKKKFNYSKLLIFGLLIAVAAFVIGNLVSNAISRKSVEIRTEHAIQLITNTEDNIRIKKL